MPSAAKRLVAQSFHRERGNVSASNAASADTREPVDVTRSSSGAHGIAMNVMMIPEPERKWNENLERRGGFWLVRMKTKRADTEWRRSWLPDRREGNSLNGHLPPWYASRHACGVTTSRAFASLRLALPRYARCENTTVMSSKMQRIISTT